MRKSSCIKYLFLIFIISMMIESENEKTEGIKLVGEAEDLRGKENVTGTSRYIKYISKRN